MSDTNNMQLPELHIEITGAVTASNLESFKVNALAVFDGIQTELVTDADFANAEKTVRWCKEVEDKLDAAKNRAMSQTATIDDLFRTIDSIKEEARQKRLTLDKLVKTRKESIRAELVRDAQFLLAAHYTHLEQRVGGAWLTPPTGIFAEAVKGKKTIDGCRDAIETAMATAKIQANEVADRIDANRKAIGEHWHLFQHDFARVCTLEAAMFSSLLNQRITEDQQRLAVERQRAEAKAAAEQQAALDRQAEAERVKARLEQEAADRASRQAQREAEAAAAREASADAVIARAITQPETVHQKPVIEKTGETFAVEPGFRDDVTDFMKTRDFGDDTMFVKFVLVEFKKFVADRDR